MKYLKLYESFNKFEIDEICRKYNIINYTINPDGSIDVNDNVCLIMMQLDKLPLRFNKVSPMFNCSSNYLKLLEGCPKISDNIICNDNELISFKYLPEELYALHISLNKIKSFKYSPKRIKGCFNCSYNNIKSFEYFPIYVGGDFYCLGNPIYEIWNLFKDTSKIELLNDFDIFRSEDTDEPAIFIDRLNDFLEMIGHSNVEKVDKYKNI